MRKVCETLVCNKVISWFNNNELIIDGYSAKSRETLLREIRCFMHWLKTVNPLPEISRHLLFLLITRKFFYPEKSIERLCKVIKELRHWLIRSISSSEMFSQLFRFRNL